MNTGWIGECYWLTRHEDYLWITVSSWEMIWGAMGWGNDWWFNYNKLRFSRKGQVDGISWWIMQEFCGNILNCFWHNIWQLIGELFLLSVNDFFCHFHLTFTFAFVRCWQRSSCCYFLGCLLIETIGDVSADCCLTSTLHHEWMLLNIWCSGIDWCNWAHPQFGILVHTSRFLYIGENVSHLLKGLQEVLFEGFIWSCVKHKLYGRGEFQCCHAECFENKLLFAWF